MFHNSTIAILTFALAFGGDFIQAGHIRAGGPLRAHECGVSAQQQLASDQEKLHVEYREFTQQVRRPVQVPHKSPIVIFDEQVEEDGVLVDVLPGTQLDTEEQSYTVSRSCLQRWGASRFTLIQPSRERLRRMVTLSGLALSYGALNKIMRLVEEPSYCTMAEWALVFLLCAGAPSNQP